MRLMRDLVGETFSNRYRLVARIAGGGMGDVYRGHDLLLDRPVAVKVLQPALAGDAELVDRFRLEARAAARLVHPNVVAVYDWGSEDEATYYMVMEYVPGTDLRDVLVGRGVLQHGQALEIMVAVCEGLAAAHAEGLVHRDIKPENVLISRKGRVKVADFGIAAVADAERTQPGGLPGTLRYMSPEQAQGQQATFKSDIWAAGVVLAECLTGRPPLQGSGGGNDLLRRRAEEPPVAPSAMDPSIPPDLDKIVLKACALDPEERYFDAAEMARALRAAGVWSVPYAPGVESLLEDLTGEVMLPDDMEPTAHLQKPRGRRRPRARSVLKGAAVALLMALVVFAGIKSVPALMGPAEVEVPEVAHLARDGAARRIREAGLRVEVERKKDKFERRGQVLTQTPARGVLEEGSTVALVVSAGPPVVQVPSVVGMKPEAAEKLLHEEGRFDVGEIVREFSLERIGSVIAQSPDDRRLPWGSTLTLTVSKGPEPMEIPSVAGLDPERAQKKIENARLIPVMVDAYSDDVPAGGVIGTEPGAGEVLLEGSEIEVYVSVGPEFEELSMPDVRGMTVKAARAELEGIGLRVRVVESCKGGGTVGETDPLAGTTVKENDLVALFVC